MRLNNKIAFVTGASRGIGKGIARKLLSNGIHVAVGYRHNKELAMKLSNEYDNALAVRVDISSRESIKSAIKECEQHFTGKISILINNAAIAQEKPFLEITDEDWDIMLITNLRGVFAFSQEVIPGMIQKKWGRIINITSIAGQWGGFNQVHYAAAKAGIINLTRSLAKLYSKEGITTNAVAIGLARTDMSSYEINSEAGKEKVRNIPIGRLATVEEVAETVAFLASEDASYITGQTINVNGGMYFG